MGSAAQLPILIVGVGRSGTTAVFTGLVRHPDVLGAQGELPLVSSFGPFVHKLENSPEREWLFGSMAISRQVLHARFRRLIFEVAVGKYGGLPSRLSHLARGDVHAFSKRCWCGKTYLDAEGFRGIRALYPDVKLIYVLRNGCEVVESRRHFPSFARRSFSDHCQQWADGVAKYRYLRDLDAAIEIRHRDFLHSPEEEFAKIFELSGLRPHPRPAAWVRRTLVHPLARPTQKDVDVRQVFAERSAAHEAWTPEQRETFREICGEAMEEVGYPMPF